MTKTLVGAMVVGWLLSGSAVPASAQDIHIDLSWGSPNVRAGVRVAPQGLRVVGHVGDARAPRRAPYRIERRHYTQCVREGSYLYCWDANRAHRSRALVQVYVVDRHEARRYDRGRRGWDRNWERRHQRAAERAWRRWADAHRYRYDRDRLIVDVSFAW
jgi:hypothetical protein